MSLEIDQKVSQKLTEMVYKSTLSGQLAAVVNAALVAYLMKDVVPVWLVISWFSYAVLQGLLRLILVRAYRRQTITPENESFWRRLFFYGVCLSALVWGGAVVLFMPYAHFEQQFFLAFVIGGMVAGGASLLSPLLPAYYVFALLPLTPLVVHLITGETLTHRIGGIMALSFGLVVTKGARLYHASLQDALRLGLEKSELAQHLDEARLKAESASQVKGAFLANMSHELRTPINGVMGLTEILLHDEVTPTQRDYLQLIQTSSKNLLSMVNDVLDFSKLEAYRLEFENRAFGLREAVTACIRILPTHSRAKPVDLQLNIADEIPDCLIGDPGRLSQVLLNLLANALKFTSQGFVRLDIALLQQTDQRVKLRFSVSDSGIGVSPEKLNLIFDPFTQADSSTTRRYGGTGLGLAISAELVERMGGRIYVSSVLDGGSTFCFVAPFEIGQPQAALSISPAERYAGRRVLLAMSDSGAADYYQLLFTSLGAQILRSYTLSETQQRLDCTDGLDLILADKSLAEIQTLITLKSLQPDVPLVLITEQWSLNESSLCKGMDGVRYIQSPLSLGDIVRLLTELPVKNQVLPAVGVDKQTKALTSSTKVAARILLVEDTLINQTVAKAFLLKLGYQITVVNNGLEALEIIANQDFDLILMDIHMPVMDGFEATKALRLREKEQGLSAIPIIALTANVEESNREAVLMAGMVDCLSKPIDFKELERVLKQFLA